MRPRRPKQCNRNGDLLFTGDQVRALSADYTIGLNEAGNVQMKINFFESADLATFAPLTVNPESVSVVDGSDLLPVFGPRGVRGSEQFYHR